MLRALLSPIGALYGLSVARRLKKTKPVRLPIPVISLGNISVGGTGKTPLAHLIRAELTALLGGPVAILSRGYGGTLAGPVLVDPKVHSAAEVGDEPLMLAADGPVIVAKDRAAGGQFGLAQNMRALVLDDAHQNPSLAKDMSIVVVDGETGFGNGFLVPAGPLREPVITMGAISDDTIEDLADFNGTILSAELVAAPLQIDGRVLGFCGIGRPEKFDATLRSLGLDVVDMYPFADHHPYSQTDLARLSQVARDYGATLVTTQKDYVRLPKDFQAQVHVVPVTAQFADLAALRDHLRLALDRAAGRA
jgi:tetraacyldisaccharide 4'-kinase